VRLAPKSHACEAPIPPVMLSLIGATDILHANFSSALSDPASLDTTPQRQRNLELESGSKDILLFCVVMLRFRNMTSARFEKL
jgi:hypothetical protein